MSTRRLRSIRRQQRNKSSQPRSRRWLMVLLAIPLVGLVLGLGSAVAVVAYVDSLIPSDLALDTPSQSTFIYDRNGEFLYEIHGDERRTNIKLEDLPQHVIDATIALEDQDFYNHGGISLLGIARAAIINIQMDASTGASTITQQLVRNRFLTLEKSYERKIKEVVYSFRIEEKYSKDEILQAYLNYINYGQQAYGIQAAAERYFNKEAKDLNIPEAAALAGMPQLPTYNNLFSGATRDVEEDLLVNLDDPGSWLHQNYIRFGRTEGERLVIDRWRQRQIKALDQMVITGKISLEQAEEALNYPIEPSVPYEAINAPHFVFYVQDLLYQKFGEEKIRTGGLQVYTSLDMNLQREAERLAKEQIDTRGAQYNASNAAVVAIDPTNGQILAHVGSINYFDSGNDGNVDVANSPNRQPGSSFKPFVYAAALEKGANSETMTMDVITNFGSNYEPKNYDFREHGPVSMRTALANSYNIPAVKFAAYVGVDGVKDFARRLGITTISDDRDYGLSIGLGSAEAKLYDMVSAYAVFANMGKKVPLNPILKITDNQGQVIEEFQQPELEEVIDPGIAYTIADILSDDQARTPAFGWNTPLRVSRKAAVKTGTTNDIRDNWTIGFTPNLVSGVWVGNNNNDPLCCGASGVTGAAPIWHDFMEKAFESIPSVDWYQRPDSAAWITVDAFSGRMPGEFTGEDTKSALGLRSMIPSMPVDDMRVRVEIDTSNGKLANSATPDELREERAYFDIHPLIGEENPTYTLWLEAIDRWATASREADPLSPYAVPTEISDNYYNEQNAPGVTLSGIEDGARIRTNSATLTAEVSGPFKIEEVSFFLGSQQVQSIQGQQASYSHEYNLSNGQYALTAKARDERGAVGEASITVTVDNSFHLTITSPDNNDYVTGSFDVTVDYNDPSPIKQVVYTLGDKSWTASKAPFTQTIKADDGKYTLTATATAENGKTTSDSVSVTVDSNAPAAFDPQSACSSPVATENVCKVTFEPADSGSGIANMQIYVKPPNQTNAVKVQDVTYTPAAYNLRLEQKGVYEIYATASDRAGHERRSSTLRITAI